MHDREMLNRQMEGNATQVILIPAASTISASTAVLRESLDRQSLQPTKPYP